MDIRAELRSRREIEVSFAAHDDAGATVDVRVGVQVCTDVDGSLEVSVEVGEVGVGLAVDNQVAAGVEAGVRGAVCGELDVRGKVEASIGVGADAQISGAAEGRVRFESIPFAKVQSSGEGGAGSDDEVVALTDLQGAWDAAETLGDEAGAGAA